MQLLPLFVALLFGYCLVDRKLRQTPLTGPIVFTLGGSLALVAWPNLASSAANRASVLALAEVGLVMVLFTDACRTDLTVLRRIGSLPTRLLSLGLLLTLALGALLARLMFPELSIWEAAILSCILAPTDAGLGQVIVESPKVPVAVRQALNVEAGLNDGLAVPFLMFSMAMAESRLTGPDKGLSRLIYEQLGLGVLVGLSVGLLGGLLLGRAHRAGWLGKSQIALVCVPVVCMLGSEAAGASMFIAAFVAGLGTQIGFPEAAQHSLEFIEDWGQLLNWIVFSLFGVLACRAWPTLGPAVIGYALLSLTIVRILPVALALTRTHLSWASKLFMGWFGPRGLASIVLGLVYLEQEIRLPGESRLIAAVTATVGLSIFAHGLSAGPGIAWYTRQIANLDPDAPEHHQD